MNLHLAFVHRTLDLNSMTCRIFVEAPMESICNFLHFFSVVFFLCDGKSNIWVRFHFQHTDFSGSRFYCFVVFQWLRMFSLSFILLLIFLCCNQHNNELQMIETNSTGKKIYLFYCFDFFNHIKSACHLGRLIVFRVQIRIPSVFFFLFQIIKCKHKNWKRKKGSILGNCMRFLFLYESKAKFSFMTMANTCDFVSNLQTVDFLSNFLWKKKPKNMSSYIHLFHFHSLCGKILRKEKWTRRSVLCNGLIWS